MAKKKLKWYDILEVFFGTIVSFADPITDILTLVEFYREDHKTWFGVGLTFIIFPCLVYVISHAVFESRDDGESEQEERQSRACKYTYILFLGCNPLFPAWLKLRTLFFYLKKLLKLRQGSNNDQKGEDFDGLLSLSKFAVLAEAALESAPQFIIQLYAMVVQQESVSIIQMVSLPVSFLSLAWASTVADEFIHSDGGDLDFSVKERVLMFSTHLFILSSRLFAVALFTVSYKWWVTTVLIFHCTGIAVCDTVWHSRGRGCDQRVKGRSPCVSIFFFCFNWLRDNLSIVIVIIGDDGTKNRNKHLRRMQLVSNVLFVIENITMILLFYFSHFRHTWFSLPVTICVCLFAVLGAVMRLTLFYFITKESDSRRSRSTQRSYALSSTRKVTPPWLQQYIFETSI